MSDAPKRPRPEPTACTTQGRRRTKPKHGAGPRTRGSRDGCPEQRRLPDPDHEAFVAWFVAYWQGHGAQLITTHNNLEA
jgi:hypothetical protein